ncbi:CHAT domain-containing protein [Streptomyces sp. 8N706]|uniref:CHAT domain-containing protein n=1 Tax=Streptomyces sp. 8N706 TaxID=3457416 RepID=UPI003FD5CF80
MCGHNEGLVPGQGRGLEEAGMMGVRRPGRTGRPGHEPNGPRKTGIPAPWEMKRAPAAVRGGARRPGPERVLGQVVRVPHNITRRQREQRTARPVHAGGERSNTLAHPLDRPFRLPGHGDLDNPSDGRLMLFDGPLKVTEIISLRIDHAELAYLGACSSARSSLNLPNEAIHISSAFQLAGYANVIATLWDVPDVIAASVAEDFYRALRDGPAVACHKVAHGRYEVLPDQPLLWAAYVHAGI